MIRDNIGDPLKLIAAVKIRAITDSIVYAYNENIIDAYNQCSSSLLHVEEMAKAIMQSVEKVSKGFCHLDSIDIEPNGVVNALIISERSLLRRDWTVRDFFKGMCGKQVNFTISENPTPNSFRIDVFLELKKKKRPMDYIYLEETSGWKPMSL